MKYMSWFLVPVVVGVLCSCQADTSPGSRIEPAPASAAARTVKQDRSLPLLTVLPVAFSTESKRNYPHWIESMEKKGYGNAIWQELEDILYDANRFELVMEPPAESEEFRRILAARGAGMGDADHGITIDLPDRVLTINVNFFVRTSESMSMLSSHSRKEFHATVYLRYFDLENRAINRAVPATGDAVGGDLLDATRAAARKATRKLLQRLDR